MQRYACPPPKIYSCTFSARLHPPTSPPTVSQPLHALCPRTPPCHSLRPTARTTTRYGNSTHPVSAGTCYKQQPACPVAPGISEGAGAGAWLIVSRRETAPQYPLTLHPCCLPRLHAHSPSLTLSLTLYVSLSLHVSLSPTLHVTLPLCRCLSPSLSFSLSLPLALSLFLHHIPHSVPPVNPLTLGPSSAWGG